MERPAILELMVKLKLRGMRAAYDEIMTLAAKLHHPPERVVGELLAAQLAEVESRATAYRMGNARFPVMKTLSEFDFAGSPVNATLVRELHKGAFLAEGRNAVLIGGPVPEGGRGQAGRPQRRGDGGGLGGTVRYGDAAALAARSPARAAGPVR